MQFKNNAPLLSLNKITLVAFTLPLVVFVPLLVFTILFFLLKGTITTYDTWIIAILIIQIIVPAALLLYCYDFQKALFLLKTIPYLFIEEKTQKKIVSIADKGISMPYGYTAPQSYHSMSEKLGFIGYWIFTREYKYPFAVDSQIYYSIQKGDQIEITLKPKAHRIILVNANNVKTNTKIETSRNKDVERISYKIFSFRVKAVAIMIAVALLLLFIVHLERNYLLQ